MTSDILSPDEQLERRRAISREASRRYAANNPEKAREASKRWREKNKEKVSAANRAWWQADPERAKELRHRSHTEHREKRLLQRKAWEEANKEHVKTKRRERYEATKTERRASMNQKRLGRKQQLVAMLGGKCKDCGGVPHIAAFEFDHVGTKTHPVSLLLAGSTWERILAEVAQCELVCANCHRIRTASRTGVV